MQLLKSVTVNNQYFFMSIQKILLQFDALTEETQ